MKKSLLGLGLALSLTLTACGGTTPKEPAAPTPATKALTKLSVRLDWSANAIHAPLFAAQSEGFFKAEGLDVQIQPASDKDDVLKLVDTGVDQVGLYYQSSVLKAPSKGYDLKVFGAYVQHPLNVLLVDERAGVADLKGLAGKKIGFTSDPMPKGKPSTTAAAIKQMVEKAGGDWAKVELINVGEAAVQALATRQVDAIAGVYEYHEGYLLSKEGIKTKTYRLNEHGAPDFYELVWVTKGLGAAEQAAFLRAVAKGVEWTAANPQKAADLLIKAAPTLKPEYVQSTLPLVLPYLKGAGAAMSRERWESAADWLVAQGAIPAKPDLSKLLVP
jgi:putative hydroxymethylpyrimidine transport system substrate-binding protein